MFFKWQDKLVKIAPRLETKGYQQGPIAALLNKTIYKKRF